MTPNVVYRADVTNLSNNDSKFYIGLAETPFKDRFRNHTKDIKHEKYSNSTELAKYVWSLKKQNIEFSINWKLLIKVNGNANKLSCNLCLSEKLTIIEAINDSNLLNSRSEFISKCRHLNKYLLKYVKGNGVT